MSWSQCTPGGEPGGGLPVAAELGDIIFWNGLAWISNNEGIPDVGAVPVFDGASWVPVVTELIPPGTVVNQFLLWDGANWNPATLSLIQNIASGTVIANGANTVQAVAVLPITAGDTVIITRVLDGGAPGLPPTIVVVPAAGFNATFALGDTSTYDWRVIR